ncbi:OmpA family protein [Brevundimonas sp.]|uniref:OmpA family protein n=1 Tax=Brevundimonas sp. TaxID=1871086 RepID=UPI0012289944|nr:OmpA family protein [Brevundimonas sp.]TAJ64676.1 MAG: OmpA family protein [Brevundimonas sp.]
MTRFIGLAALAVAAAGLSGCGVTRFMDRSAVVAEPSPCTTKRFEVYFADSEARLTEPARQAIGMTAAQLQGCDIRKVQVLGLSDARGGATANQSLSERRAVAVAEALAAAGWPAPVFDVDAGGEEGAVTDAGVREPMRRRTEVVIEAVPRR